MNRLSRNILLYRCAIIRIFGFRSFLPLIRMYRIVLIMYYDECFSRIFILSCVVHCLIPLEVQLATVMMKMMTMLAIVSSFHCHHEFSPI